MEIGEAKEHLLRVARDDWLRERTIQLEQVGHATTRHPLDKHVEVSAGLRGAENADNVCVIQTSHHLDLAHHRLTNVFLLSTRVAAE